MSRRTAPSGRVTGHVAGAPFRTGDLVFVVRAVDRGIYDVSRTIGSCGVVDSLEYGDLGTTFPADPLVIVRLEGGNTEVYFREEIARAV